MVEVSDSFRELALSAGRHVFCKIFVGNEEFLDDRLMEFSFDDVTHPDWFTIGTACANRFHFRAKFDGEIAVNEEVRPYISFDGTEWCPLGIFYVSRRYVRGGVISITAYDRMYSLDMEYSFPVGAPTDAVTILRDICDSYGISAVDYGYPYTVETLPEICTVRDMIGYIAALNRGCAKINRYGSLVLRKCGEITEHISDLNCMDIRRNMTSSGITCIKAETDSGMLESGSGTEISTLELYNPLMTERQLESLLSQLKPLTFYGADVEMQGLPYLESGEMIWLLEGKMIYPVIISEMELYYDGALTGRIYSRNKTNIDALVHEDDLEQALDNIRTSIGAVAMKYINEEQLVINHLPSIIADFTFECAAEGFAELNINLGVSESTADFLAFKIYINSADSGRSVAHTPEPVSRQLVHLYHLETALPKGKSRIFVTAQTGSGEAYVLPNAMLAGLVVHGASPSASGGVRDNITLFDAFPAIAVSTTEYDAAHFDESVDAQ